MPTVLITGGTGMIGKALSAMLVQKNYEVIILTRSAKASTQKGISYAQWNVEKGTIDTSAIEKADYIIHLAGANVAEKRWTAARKKEIVESRTKSGALLVQALRDTKNTVKAIISSSAIGWYGPDTATSLQNGFNEDAPAYTDFLATTVQQWEANIEPAAALGKRVAFLRTGIVLDNEGGAYKEFKKPVKFGIAAILGNGKQVVSWIHVEDICRMYIYAIENNINGVFNAVAPNPVTNKELVLAIAKKIKGNSFITMHVPSFILKLALGEMSIEVLKSTTVNCNKIKQAGFQFLYPTIDAALNDLEQ